MTVDRLEQEVLKLPGEQRARLAKRILASLDDVAEFEREWFQELKRRRRELEAATLLAIPLQDAATSAREQRRLTKLCGRPGAMDHFIEAWKASKADDRAASHDGPWPAWIRGILRRRSAPQKASAAPEGSRRGGSTLRVPGIASVE